MNRLLLVHWDKEESRERATRLRRLGHRVVVFHEGSSRDLSAHRDRPPHAVVIDLSRLPSQGGAVGTQLRRWKATRSVPLVFLGGEPQAVAKVRALLPDAQYATWRGIRGALRRALRTTPIIAAPAVPDAMAGYSGTPLPKKLGIRAGHRVALLGAPKDFLHTLGPLPEGVSVRTRVGPADITLLFVRNQSDLQRRFPGVTKVVPQGGRIWIVWPKQASGVATDLGGNQVRAYGLDRKWVDFKICAVDATWSGLCFSRRT